MCIFAMPILSEFIFNRLCDNNLAEKLNIDIKKLLEIK